MESRPGLAIPKEPVPRPRAEGGWRGEGGAPLALALGLVLLALLGVAAVAWASPYGIGVGYDSMFYLTSAESLSGGQGLRWAGGGGELRPLTHYPPLYPVLLAGVVMLGLDVLTAARWSSAILLGLNVVAAGIVTTRLAGSHLAGLAAGALLLVSPILLDVHLEAMSEPLFLLLLIVALAGLAEHNHSGSRAALLAASVASALAYLTRYVGMALIVCGVGLVLMWPVRRAGRRLAEAGMFVAIPVIAVAAWSARNLALTGSASNRMFNFHPITRSALRQAVDTVSGWLLPATIDLRVRLVAWLLAAILATVIVWRAFRSTGLESGNPGRSFLRVGLLFCGVYLSALVISLLFFDASTRWTDRILSPIHTVLLLGAVVCVGCLPGRWQRSVVVLLMLIGASYLWRSWDLLTEARVTGRGFNTAAWRSSDTMAWVSQLPPDTIVYSNEAFPIQFFTGIPAYWVPERIDSVKGMLRPEFGDQMQEMRSRLRQPGSVLVIFTGSHHRVELPPLEELTQGLVQIGDTGDGLIFVDPVNLDRFVRPE